MTRVLLVDDELDAVLCVQMMLEMDGFDVFSTTSSPTAIEMLGRERFDVVISDLEMPHVRGVEVIHAALRANPGARVYVVSGALVNSPECAQALAAGAARVFTKPLDYDDLAAQLRTPWAELLPAVDGTLGGPSARGRCG